MIAIIDQVTTTAAGNLALHVTYWQDGQQVNAQRHEITMPVAHLEPYRNANGLRERLDGVEVADSPTEQDEILAQQIGLKMEVLTLAGSVIAERAVTAAKAFAASHRRAATLQAQTAAAMDEQLTSMAAGRVQHWTQVQQVAEANGDTQTAAAAAYRLGLAEQAAANAAIARQLAQAEIAPQVLLLTPEPAWPAGESDPRGYLRPEVLALVGTEWECE